jgi:copper ion binding protein
MTKTILNVTGMSCHHCEASVHEALSGVAGVKKVKVSLKKGNAAVKYDEAAATADALIAAVAEAGFSASIA